MSAVTEVENIQKKKPAPAISDPVAATARHPNLLHRPLTNGPASNGKFQYYHGSILTFSTIFSSPLAHAKDFSTVTLIWRRLAVSYTSTSSPGWETSTPPGVKARRKRKYGQLRVTRLLIYLSHSSDGVQETDLPVHTFIPLAMLSHRLNRIFA